MGGGASTSLELSLPSLRLRSQSGDIVSIVVHQDVDSESGKEKCLDHCENTLP